MVNIRTRSLTMSGTGSNKAKGRFLKLIVLTISMPMLLYLGGYLLQFKVMDFYGGNSGNPNIADRAYFAKAVKSQRSAKSRSSRVLAALPTGNSDEDIERVSKAVSA